MEKVTPKVFLIGETRVVEEGLQAYLEYLGVPDWISDAPIGLATTIGWSVNPRALRWIIEMRTSRHAEEEIRLVFSSVAEIAIERYPNLFGDFNVDIVDGLPEYTTPNSKV